MSDRNKVTVSTQPPRAPVSLQERRAAQLDEVANKQAQLKREAAERRERAGASTAPTAVVTQP